MTHAFHRFATRVSELAGSPAVFIVALAVVLGWAMSGPFLGFSETWQLTINTGTTIVTFLMVFLIQHTQNAGDDAMHAKLDEILLAIPQADNSKRGIEDTSR